MGPQTRAVCSTRSRCIAIVTLPANIPLTQAVAADVELQLAAINFSYGGITNQNKPEVEEPISPGEVRRQVRFEIAKHWWTSQHTSAPQHTPNAQDTQRPPVTQNISAAQRCSTQAECTGHPISAVQSTSTHCSIHVDRGSYSAHSACSTSAYCSIYANRTSLSVYVPYHWPCA